MNETERDSSLRERLVLVEQQQHHQKETLVEINEALREVVKTQHILANQRREIDGLTKEQDEVSRRLHLSDIEDAKRRAAEEQQSTLIETLRTKVVDEIEPQQAKTRFYFKLAATISGGLWGLLLIGLSVWLKG